MSLCQCRCRNVATVALLGLASVLIFHSLPRRPPQVSEQALDTLDALLQPVFSWSGSPISPHDLSLKEVLEARILAARAYCSNRRPASNPDQVKNNRRSLGQLTWCGHPGTVTEQIHADLERFAAENRERAIVLDRENYYSMPMEDNSTGMAWNISEHPLLLMTRALLNVQHGKPGWSELAGGGPASLDTLLQLAVSAQSGPGRRLLGPAADACALCAAHYDFVLHAGQLQAELAFLAAEMGWSGAPTAAAERERRQLLGELLRQLPRVPPHLLQLAKRHFAADLAVFGYRIDLDALYRLAA